MELSEKVKLQREIERLTRELDQASSEQIQSAQYGLVLLEEKKSLEQRCEDLEAVYENTKHELDITLKVRSSSTSYLIIWFTSKYSSCRK